MSECLSRLSIWLIQNRSSDGTGGNYVLTLDKVLDANIDNIVNFVLFCEKLD